MEKQENSTESWIRCRAVVRDTSLLAYTDKVLPFLSAKQIVVLRFFKRNLDRDFTNAELAQVMGWAINRITPRTGELRELGLIGETQRRACRVTGNLAWAKRLKQ